MHAQAVRGLTLGVDQMPVRALVVPTGGQFWEHGFMSP